MGIDLGLFKIGFPGEGKAEAANKNLDNQAAMFNRWNTQYYEPGLAALWGQYNSPNSNYQRAQMGQLQGQTFRDTQGAAQQLQQGMAQRGLGQSSLMSNNLGALWGAYGNTMANARMQQMGNLEQQRQQALARLMGAINPQAATGIYNQQLQDANRETANFLQSLNPLAQLAGTIFKRGK